MDVTWWSNELTGEECVTPRPTAIKIPVKTAHATMSNGTLTERL